MSEIKTVLAEFKRFLIELAKTPIQPTSPEFWLSPSTMFSIEEYGGAGLSGTELDRYLQLLEKLCKTMGASMSEASIRKLIQTAILKMAHAKGIKHATSSIE